MSKSRFTCKVQRGIIGTAIRMLFRNYYIDPKHMKHNRMFQFYRKMLSKVF